MLGVFCSLLASLLFGGLYYLATWLRPLEGQEIFGFRMLVTLPFLFLAVFVLKKQAEFIAFLKRIRQEPYLILVLIFTAFFVGLQMWLFLWAPNSGRAIEVSVGYLLMPIMMVIAGKWLYKEYLSVWKWIAIILASIGVLSNVIQIGAFSWASALVLTGFPFYFMVRRKFNIAHIHSFILEVVILIPVSLYFISPVDLKQIETVNEHIYFALFLLGLLSGVALISYTMASYLVPFNVLGLLGYLEPVTMMAISFFIGETLKPESYILLICLSFAILFLIIDGILNILKQQKKRKMKRC